MTMDDPIAIAIAFALGMAGGFLLVLQVGARRVKAMLAEDLARLEAERAQVEAAYARSIARQKSYTQALLEFMALLSYGAHEEAIEVIKAANAELTTEDVKS